MVRCAVNGGDITASKVLNCTVENSELKDCFFMNGYLNANMEGGVFRSGKLGQYANISSSTKMASDKDNFFDTKFDTDEYNKKEKDKSIKAFGK
jgi:hypothetical protein